MPLPIGVFVVVTRPFMLSGEVCSVGDQLELTMEEATRLIRRDKVELDPDAIVQDGEEEDEDSEEGEKVKKPTKAPRSRRAAA